MGAGLVAAVLPARPRIGHGPAGDRLRGRHRSLGRGGPGRRPAAARFGGARFHARRLLRGDERFTTTGATLIAEVDSVPDGVLLWRSMTQWLGGVGIVVLVVAVAPALGRPPGSLLRRGVRRHGRASHPLIVVQRRSSPASTWRSASPARSPTWLRGCGTSSSTPSTTASQPGDRAGSRPGQRRSPPMTPCRSSSSRSSSWPLRPLNFSFYWKAIRGAPLLSLYVRRVAAFFAILGAAIALVTISPPDRRRRRRVRAGAGARVELHGHQHHQHDRVRDR